MGDDAPLEHVCRICGWQFASALGVKQHLLDQHYRADPDLHLALIRAELERDAALAALAADAPRDGQEGTAG